MNPLRTVGGRLSIALAVVVLGALAVVWVALVPTLERRLVAGRLAELAASVRATARDAARTFPSQDFVDEAPLEGRDERHPDDGERAGDHERQREREPRGDAVQPERPHRQPRKR